MDAIMITLTLGDPLQSRQPGSEDHQKSISDPFHRRFIFTSLFAKIPINPATTIFSTREIEKWSSWGLKK